MLVCILICWYYTQFQFSTSCDWSLTLSFYPSSSIYCQVSLVVREKEEIQVSQGLLEWRERQDYRASLEAQDFKDPLDLQDQERYQESQEFQGEKVECWCFLSLRVKSFLTADDHLTVSIRGEWFCRSERFPRIAGQTWILRISRREGRSRRPWKKWTPRWSRIPWTERFEYQSPLCNNFWLKPAVLTLEWYLFRRWKRVPRSPWFAFCISTRLSRERRTWNPWKQWPFWLPWTQR